MKRQGINQKELAERLETSQQNVSKKFKEKRAEDLERILTEEGQQLRMNRSIQAEGSFGELKQDMGFRRYLCRGSQNVLAESVLFVIQIPLSVVRKFGSLFFCI